MPAMKKVLTKKMKFKKRYLIGVYLAFEIAGLAFAGTASAQILDRVKFEIPQRVASALLPQETAGLTTLIISSNAPFTISASDAIGEFDVSVRSEGLLKATPFGANAQMPGPNAVCAAAVTPSPSIIYRADKKTARAKGPILSQSIMVEIRYDEALGPKFIVKTEDNSADMLPAAQCEGRLG